MPSGRRLFPVVGRRRSCCASPAMSRHAPPARAIAWMFVPLACRRRPLCARLAARPGKGCCDACRRPGRRRTPGCKPTPGHCLALRDRCSWPAASSSPRPGFTGTMTAPGYYPMLAILLLSIHGAAALLDQPGILLQLGDRNALVLFPDRQGPGRGPHVLSFLLFSLLSAFLRAGGLRQRRRGQRHAPSLHALMHERPGRQHRLRRCSRSAS